MAQRTMHAEIGSETGGPEELIQAGAVTFGMEYRTLNAGAEEGVCIHVHNDALEGQNKELLKFDCFRRAPLPRQERHCEEDRTLDAGFHGRGRSHGLDSEQDQVPIADHVNQV